jgi:hypothetical protein
VLRGRARHRHRSWRSGGNVEGHGTSPASSGSRPIKLLLDRLDLVDDSALGGAIAVGRKRDLACASSTPACGSLEDLPGALRQQQILGGRQRGRTAGRGPEVIESIQVYRARFGGDKRLLIDADLRRGAASAN